MNRLGVGDAVGICTNQDGDLVVDSNSVEVRQATVRPTYGAAAVQHVPPPPPGKAQSFANGQALALASSCHCLLVAAVSMCGFPSYLTLLIHVHVSRYGHSHAAGLDDTAGMSAAVFTSPAA